MFFAVRLSIAVQIVTTHLAVSSDSGLTGIRPDRLSTQKIRELREITAPRFQSPLPAAGGPSTQPNHHDAKKSAGDARVSGEENAAKMHRK
jgi:hypothetical protein